MKRLLFFFLLILFCFSVPAQKSSTKRKDTATQQSSRKNSSSSSKKTTATNKKGEEQPTIKGLKNERKKLKAELAANQREQKRLDRNVKMGLENLMSLDLEISEKQKLVDTIRNDLTGLNARIRLLDRELEVLSEELEEHRTRYMKSMRYMHRNRSVQNQLMFIFSADNFNQMYRRLRFTREYAAYQKAQGEAVKSKKEQVAQKKREVADTRKKVARLLERGEKEKKLLEGKQDEQQNQVKQLKKQQRTVNALILEQQRREAELDARIDKLIAEEIAREKARQEAEARKKAATEAARKRAAELARKKAAAEAARKENDRRIAAAKAKEEAARKAAQGASQKERAQAERMAREAAEERRKAEQKAREENMAREKEIAEAKKAEENFKMPAADRKMTGSFEANRGRMPMPITGPYRLVRGFGTYSPEGLSHVRLQSNGWHLKGQPGAKARCIFDGEVSGVYKQGGLYIVTVRHGKYISAYVNLGSVNVSKGQRVKAHAILGGLASDLTMQFQLRNWSTLLNPSSWIRR